MLLGLGILLGSFSAPAADLALNGRGIATKFQSEFFAAELLAAQPSRETSELLANEMFTMRMTILIDNWTQRQFSQHWSQAILINNTADSRDQYSGEIAEWLDSVKGPLKRGDSLAFVKSPVDGFVFSINNVELYRSKRAGIANLLLNTWIGSRPPASEFKSGLLGITTLQDQVFTAALAKPSATRKAELEKWVAVNESNSEPEIIETAAVKPVAKDSPSAQPAAKPALDLASKIEDAPVVEESTRGDNPPGDETASPAPKNLASDTPAAIPGPEATSAIEPLETAETASPAGIEIASSKTEEDSAPSDVIAGDINPSPSEQLVESNDIFVPADEVTSKEPAGEQEDPLFKVYRANILTLTYQNLIYPNSAIDRGQEDKVMLRLTLNRKGKVVSFDYDKRSRFKTLNKAVEKAVSQANPYPAPPKKLKGREIVVSIPIVFSLSG